MAKNARILGRGRAISTKQILKCTWKYSDDPGNPADLLWGESSRSW